MVLKVVGSEKVDDMTFFKAFFRGGDKDIDGLILKYLGMCHYKSDGAPYPGLELYFCWKNALCSRKRLQRRLDSLVKYGFLERRIISGSTFYFLVKKEVDDELDGVD